MSADGSSTPVEPHAELLQSLGWMAGGLAILAASIRMDRLESQNINPYTVPGLLPGLLGLMMCLLGALLCIRSWRRGGRHRKPDAPRATTGEKVRIITVIALCVVFDVVLVGHGLPYWLAAWIFVSGSILILQYPIRLAEGKPLGMWDVTKSLAVGLGAGLIITVVFQELFLVRLP